MKKKINYLISFISFIGFDLGLSLVLSAGFIDLSRFYSIPMRLLLILLMIYMMVKLRFRYIPTNKLSFFLFYFFWLLYFIAIFKAMLEPTSAFYKTPLEYMSYAIGYCIIPFLFFSLYQGDYSLNTFKNAIISSGVIFSIVTYILYGQLLFLGVGRISMAQYLLGGATDVISPLTLSYASSLIISICLYYILYGRVSKRTYFYYWGAIIISMIPFYLGASRGSVVALVLTFVVIVLVKGTYKKKIKSIIILVIVGFVIIYSSEELKSLVFLRVLNISEDVEIGSSSANRIYMWEGAWSQFLESPILGDSIYSKIPPFPHNIILEVLMSVGLLGFIPFIILLLLTIIKSIKIIKYRPEHGWVFILFFQGVIQNQFSGSVIAALFFWAGMGLVLSVKINKKQKLIV